MNEFYIRFRVVDHFADDAGYLTPIELTIVEAEDKQKAILKFIQDMEGENYQIDKVSIKQ